MKKNQNVRVCGETRAELGIVGELTIVAVDGFILYPDYEFKGWGDSLSFYVAEDEAGNRFGWEYRCSGAENGDIFAL